MPWWISDMGEVFQFDAEEYLTHGEWAEENRQASYGDLVTDEWVAVRERNYDVFVEGTIRGIERNHKEIADLLFETGTEKVQIFLDDKDWQLETTPEEFAERGVAAILHRDLMRGGDSATMPAQQSIEGQMPSGRPIRFGDRHPVAVRRHRRRQR